MAVATGMPVDLDMCNLINNFGTGWFLYGDIHGYQVFYF